MEVLDQIRSIIEYKRTRNNPLPCNMATRKDNDDTVQTIGIATIDQFSQYL